MRLLLSILLISSIAIFDCAKADSVQLKVGGRIRGDLLSSKSDSLRNMMTLVTPTGSRIIVERKDVGKVKKRSTHHEEYEAKIRISQNTVESQWELAEWCKKNYMTIQHRKHLNAILKLDPNNLMAHRGLKHVLRNGVWTTRDQLMKSQGYVKYKGEYVTPEELAIISKQDEEKQSEKSWYKKVSTWGRWLRGSNGSQQNLAQKNLMRINDYTAIAALSENFSNDKNRNIRMLYTEILNQIPHDKSLQSLVDQSLLDVDKKVRSHSLDLIQETRSFEAVPVYISRLNHDVNVVVRRAALALGQLGFAEAIPALIDSLVTIHKYKVRVEQTGTSVSMGSNGSTAYGNQSRALPPEVEAKALLGLYPNGIIINDTRPKVTKVVTVKVDRKNMEVLNALKLLTEKDYGFNERRWKNWWVAKKNSE